MTLGIAIAPAAGAVNAVDDVVGQARRAAAAGVRSAWFGQLFSYDSITLATVVGREVPEISVGVSVVPIAGRHPLLVASQAQTAQAATGGRFTLGLGLGAPAFAEPVYGVPNDRRITRLREFLTVVRSVFETGTASFDGELITAKPPMTAKVAGAAPVPVVVAAMGPQALRVTGELADGTMPLLAGPKALANHIVPSISAAAEAAGRPAPKIIAALPALVTSAVETARQRVAEQTAFYDGIPSYQRIIELSGASKAAELAVVGDEETVAAEIRRYFDAGATEVVVTQSDLAGTADQLRTWRLVGELTRSVG
ncbi:TIGR03564 family F420-dependent LLM class oxidoreductase [Amycolatopsis sp. 195334CR]|uniref:TIGR03564 family F420-dependent LLM class oxidoreductase n=1 Tax=Amycolatopsis sp. 195334CR TaxID=2814588 RepID=UPI001A8C276B|nr:TIGR03564 family F420-dependent LLM class oxidoreductase [Amycolatopsis sp. 195334CR]MBN6035844.1 TIGR03564 family F420-dependent LLM class oxidoreductase [Amycolatopsis sp. 195334CR]